MKKLSKILFVLVSAFGLAMVPACDRNEGSAEEAGEWVDDKFDDAGDAMEDVGDDIEDAAD